MRRSVALVAASVLLLAGCSPAPQPPEPISLLANAIFLAQPYGTPVLYSGYAFEGRDAGPPQDDIAAYSINGLTPLNRPSVAGSLGAGVAQSLARLP